MDAERHAAEHALDLAARLGDEEGRFAAGEDEPEEARLGGGGVTRRRDRAAVGVRVIVADDSLAARALGFVRRNQQGRVDLEHGRRIGGGVGSWAGVGDGPFVAEEQPADLAIRLARGIREDLVEQAACNRDSHGHIRYGMNAGVSIRRAVVPPEAAGWRLDRALAAAIPTLSRERLKALISSGQVSAETGAPVRDPATKVDGGAAFAVAVPDPKPAHNVPQHIPLKVVFEDEHLIVVDKPAGMVVHPAAGNADGTLVNALLHHCRGSLSGIGGVERPGIVHRIDKDTSGLIVAAKSDPAHVGLAAQFARHSIDRRYLAIVAGVPRLAEGSIDAPLARSATNRQKIAIVRAGRGRRAVTHYRLVSELKRAALVECRLETGRTHQVRVHMASIGHPLLGDPVYGRGRPEHRDVLNRLGFHRQALHAARLGFIHPITSAALAFVSEIPDDMQGLFSELML